MIAAVLLRLAEIELEYRQERQAAGIEVAKRKGVYKGRQRGTTKGKPDRAIALAERGLQVAEIAEALGTSERTVHPYLRTGNWVRSPNQESEATPQEAGLPSSSIK